MHVSNQMYIYRIRVHNNSNSMSFRHVYYLFTFELFGLSQKVK